MSGESELSNDEHIERRIERLSHLEGHRDAAARQSQHDHGISTGVPTQLGSQLNAGFTTVREWLIHLRLPLKRAASLRG
jgi:hypothetical protein